MCATNCSRLYFWPLDCCSVTNNKRSSRECIPWTFADGTTTARVTDSSCRSIWRTPWGQPRAHRIRRRSSGSLLERFGFDGLSYVVARDDGLAASGEIAWSTHPRSWSALYRREAYAAVDPRLDAYAPSCNALSLGFGRSRRRRPCPAIRPRCRAIRHPQQRCGFAARRRVRTRRAHLRFGIVADHRRASRGDHRTPGRPDADRHGAARRACFRGAWRRRPRASTPARVSRSANAIASSSPPAE